MRCQTSTTRQATASGGWTGAGMQHAFGNHNIQHSGSVNGFELPASPGFRSTMVLHPAMVVPCHRCMQVLITNRQMLLVCNICEVASSSLCAWLSALLLASVVLLSHCSVVRCVLCALQVRPALHLRAW
jgi:hypothetical protein